MSDQDVTYEVIERVATITLNRPARLNAWTPRMGRQLLQAFERASRDPDAGAIVLTGAGRGFCAGLDKDLLNARANGVEPEEPAPAGPMGGATRLDYAGRFTFLPFVGKVVICAVNGAAAGSGMVLALSADLRFASTDATFTTAFSTRGLTAEHGIAWLLPRLIGVGAAADLLFSSRRLSAEEAFSLGLVNRVVSPDRLLSEARAYARSLIDTCSPRSLQIIKRQLWDAQLQGLGEAISSAESEMLHSLRSPEFQAALRPRAQALPEDGQA